MGLREFTSVPADPRDWGRWMRAQFIIADSVAPNVIATNMIIDDAVTFAKIENVAALSVVGRPVNSAGDASSISAASDLTLVRRSGAAVGFGTITSAYVSDFNEACQDAALAALTDSSELDWTYNDGAGTASASLVSASVVFAKLQNIATSRIVGRATAGSGSMEELTAAQVATIVATAIASELNLTATSYSQTLTNVTNVDSSTALGSVYLRLGNVVLVAGAAQIDATALAATEVGISLPVASNLGAFDCWGAAGANAIQQSGAILADAANDRARIQYVATSTAAQVMWYVFGYLVI